MFVSVFSALLGSIMDGPTRLLLSLLTAVQQRRWFLGCHGLWALLATATLMRRASLWSCVLGSVGARFRALKCSGPFSANVV